MRVLFDAYWLDQGPPSGRRVVGSLLTQWRRDFPDDELHIAATASCSFQTDDVTRHRVRLRPHSVSNAVELARIARRLRPDLVVAQNFGPLRTPHTLMVYDVIYQRHPEWFTRAELLYLSFIRRQSHAATAVVTSARSEAARLAEVGWFAGRPIVVSGLSVPVDLVEAEPIPPADAPDPFGYVLVVGRLNVRKNLGLAVRAMPLVRARSGRPVSLVVVGSPDGAAEQLDTLADPADPDSRLLRFTGSISDGELAWLYRNCAAFVFGSRDEGYGLPLLEAQHFGCPVACSDIPPFRELADDRCEFFDPDDPSDAADAIVRAMAHGHRPDHGVQPSWSPVVRAIRQTAVRSAA